MLRWRCGILTTNGFQNVLHTKLTEKLYRFVAGRSTPRIRRARARIADSGRPSVVSEPDGEIAAIYKGVARRVAVKIAERAKDFSSKFPTISVSKDT